MSPLRTDAVPQHVANCSPLNPKSISECPSALGFIAVLLIYTTKTIMPKVLKIFSKTVSLNWRYPGSYAKYVSRSGGSHWKKSEVVFPYRHVSPFLRIVLTMYIFPTLLSPNFKFFLKSRNLK